MLLASLWGIFGATWFLFALEELQLGPARSGSSPGSAARRSFIGAIVAPRGSTERWGIGRVAIAAMLLSAPRQPVHPAGPGRPARSWPSPVLVAQQLVADSAVTVYDVTEVSVRQSLVARPRSSGG